MLARTLKGCTAVAFMMAVATPVLAQPNDGMSTGAPSRPVVAPLPKAGHWSVNAYGGTSFDLSGDAISASSNGNIYDPTVAASTAFSTTSKSYSDVFSMPMVFGIDIGYALNKHDEVSLGLRYSHAGGKSFTLGSFDAAGTVNGTAVAVGDSLNAKVSDLNEYGMEFGYRHFFNLKQTHFHPFLGGSLGVKQTDKVTMDLTSNGANAGNALELFKGGLGWSAGLNTGFHYDMTRRVSLGMETGIRYDSGVGKGSNNATDAGKGDGRWEIPVTAGVIIKF